MLASVALTDVCQLRQFMPVLLSLSWLLFLGEQMEPSFSILFNGLYSQFKQVQIKF